jgi:Immunoglobulin I-set domain
MKTLLTSRGLLLAALLFAIGSKISFVQAQTTLAAGDIAFVGWNSYDDGTNGATNDDQIAFVLLRDITANTVIFFTDFGWTNQSQFQTANPCGASTGAVSDGIIRWTATQNMSCGTLVWLKTKYLSTAPLASTGTVAAIYKTAGSTTPAQYVSISSSNDQVFAFQSSSVNGTTGVITNPTLVAAFTSQVAWDSNLDPCAFSSSQSMLPAALANASLVIPAVSMTDLNARDNARFNCFNTITSASGMRAAMTSSTNWTYNQTSSAMGVYNFSAFGCTFSCSSTAPSITTQPANQIACTGLSASFSMAAQNAVSYQWRVSTDGGANYTNLTNGTLYSGVTTATLNINNVTGMDGYLYRCNITNAVTTVTTNAAKLTVNRFILQPTNMSTCSSCGAGFTVIARGGNLAYQWQISTDNGLTFSDLSNGGVYSGVTTKTLAISNANGLNGRQYRCILGGCPAGVTSNAATLTVTSTASPTTLAAGDVAIVAYNASDDANGGFTQDDEIVFVLLKDIVAGTDINFTDNAVLNGGTFASGMICPAGHLKWIAGFDMSCGSQVKIKCKYLLEASTGIVIPISANPNDPTLHLSLSSSDVIFAYRGTIGSPTMLYGFHMNAWTASVASCAGSSVSILPPSLNAAGLNVALGRDGTSTKNWNNANYNCNNVTASPATLRSAISSAPNWATSLTAIVLPACVLFTCNANAPQITTQPVSTSTCDGRTASFAVVASGTNTFQWQIFNTGTSAWDNLANGGAYNNVSTATLSILNATGLDGRQYRCRVTNAFGTVNSNIATLTVNRFRSQPSNMTTCTSCQAVFSVTASGAGLTYQWQESTDGVNYTNLLNSGVYSGTTTPVLRISNVTTPTNLNSRRYRAVLGGCASPINSNAGVLTVSANAATAIQTGDITFIGYNAGDDGTDGLTRDDEFAFLLLKDINAGTEINFTDFGWRSDANAFQQANPVCNPQGGAASDGIIKWIASTNLTCGTQVVVKSKFTLQANTGVCYPIQSTFNAPNIYVSFPTVGDQLFAFTGDAYNNPTLIAGLNMRAWDATLTLCEFTSTKSVRPAALNGFVVEFTSANSNGYASYKCSATTQNIPSVLRTATQNTANWDVSNTTAFTFPLGCTFCCTAPVTITQQPTPQSVCAGTNTTFTVAISGTGTYQWQVNTGSGFANVSNIAPYSGATTATLSVNSASVGLSGFQYRCVLASGCASINTNAVTLTVNQAGSPTNVAPASNLSVNTPSTVALSATCPVNQTPVWYNVPSAGMPLGTGTPFNYTPPISGDYVFYATCRLTVAPNCETGNRTATATVRYCGNSVASLPNYSSVSTVIKALTSISVNNQVNSTSNITYQAGTFVLLSPGFQVVQGGRFEARTGGCN